MCLVGHPSVRTMFRHHHHVYRQVTIFIFSFSTFLIPLLFIVYSFRLSVLLFIFIHVCLLLPASF